MNAILFDLDQTVLDRNRSLLEYIKWQTYGMLRAEISDPEKFISRFIELDSNGTVWKDQVYEKLISEFNISNWSTRELLTVYELCFCSFAHPMDGIKYAVSNLKNNGYILGLITNGMSPFQERNFNALEMSTLFSTVLVSQAVGLRKPDPKIFELGCSELGVPPESAIFVGDNPKADIAGANSVGMKTIFIPSKLHPHCEEADEVCVDLHDLPTLIRKIS